MDRRGYLEKHGIARSVIKKDLLVFGLPALTVFILGLIVCGRDEYDGWWRPCSECSWMRR